MHSIPLPRPFPKAETPLSFWPQIRTMNRLFFVLALVLENDEMGWDVEDENKNEEEDEWLGSWRATFRSCACIGTMNPPLTPPWRGTDRTRTNVCSAPGRGWGWVASWRASSRLRACIGTMN